MGLFSFLGRKSKAPPSADDGLSPDYAFAHYALRMFALAQPLEFLAIVMSPDSKLFFEDVLDNVAENCGRKTSFDADAIRVQPVRIGDYSCAVVELPDPHEIAHAHMVALVALIDTPDIREGEPVDARYFTLEKGFQLDNTPRTVLCEWDTSSHSNYGDGPRPNVEEFVQAIGQLLKI
ncbi:hypothetical protein [Aeoliella mucimassa]|uniref:Uncharacterized protein n=1 Tax=Aeoliella mucimassa TaxID=2527972 RepID=A0A518AGI3_9BACT|nr:hypothetical protein [Aeoliella mucimassa]QDU53835.1 hypothetical protein Pan181_00130 [Aeoliella mucimassa]